MVVARVSHFDPRCPVCLVGTPGIFTTGAVVPPPYPNPEYKPKSERSQGGQHGHFWYHGTHFSPEEDDEGESDPVVQEAGGRLRTPDWSGDPGERAHEHWNTDLGVHFSSLHGVAKNFFAKPESGDIDSRVAHATLHMKNPKHFDSEHDMTHEAIDWAQKNGLHYLPQHHRAHEEFENGHYEGVADHDKTGVWDEVNTESMPHSYDARHAISRIDRHGPSWEVDDPEAQPEHKETWLATHPQRSTVTEGYRQHLQSQGHDGIVYGNEHEGPQGHASAIAFPETPVAIHKWEWFHPEHTRPANAQESAEKMRMAPSPRQLKLFAAHDDTPLDFSVEEQETGGSKRPIVETLKAIHPDKGHVGTLRYFVPRRKADSIYIDGLHVPKGHRGNGYASQLMDEMQRRHPKTPIDHGGRTDDGKAWWANYTEGKTVQNGRTMAARNRLQYEMPKPGPITFDYIHNTEKSPDFGNRYGQDIEPHGRYISMRPENRDAETLDPKRHETGTVTFQNPLHIPFGGGYAEDSNWKRQLSQRFDNKTGKDLSDAVRAAGHDAIMTHDDYGPDEIVDLTTKQRPRSRTAASYTYNQTVMGPAGYEDRVNTVEGPLYHGGRANLAPGEHLTIGRKPNEWGDDAGKSTHNYFTSNPDTAFSYAQQVGRRGRVYEVEPTGEFKMDHSADDFKTKHPVRVVREVPREEWPDWAKKASKTAVSDWNFEHFNPEGGKHWRMFGGPAEEPRRHMMEYSKTPEGKLDFGGSMGAERLDRKAGPEVLSRMKDEALRHHDTTEHDPAAQPPPEPAKPKRRVYYHGTTMPNVTHILPANHHGGGVIFKNETDKDFAYATPDLGHAWDYAQKASDFTGSRPRVYQVRPLRGHQDVEPDPTWDPVRNRSRGNNETDMRSRHGFEVLREMKAPRNVRDSYTDSEWGED